MDNVIKGWNKKVIMEIEGKEIEFDEFKGIFDNDERCFGEIENVSFDSP